MRARSGYCGAKLANVLPRDPVPTTAIVTGRVVSTPLFSSHPDALTSAAHAVDGRLWLSLCCGSGDFPVRPVVGLDRMVAHHLHRSCLAFRRSSGEELVAAASVVERFGCHISGRSTRLARERTSPLDRRTQRVPTSLGGVAARSCDHAIQPSDEGTSMGPLRRFLGHSGGDLASRAS